MFCQAGLGDSTLKQKNYPGQSEGYGLIPIFFSSSFSKSLSCFRSIISHRSHETGLGTEKWESTNSQHFRSDRSSEPDGFKITKKKKVDLNSILNSPSNS